MNYKVAVMLMIYKCYIHNVLSKNMNDRNNMRNHLIYKYIVYILNGHITVSLQ